MSEDSLAGFACAPFSSAGFTYDVYSAGVGPGVVVMAELPGITPAVVGFARKVVDLGLTVHVPDLFGVAGGPSSTGAMLRVLPKVCIAREFSALALRTTAPVVQWLRALLRQVHERSGGPGVGAVGMCFTGGFALAMSTEPEMLAAVMSQPSLPIGLRIGSKHDLGCSDADLATIAERARVGDVEFLGLRFSEDKLCPPQRFARLHEVLGPAFMEVQIDSSPGNPSGHGRSAHSVLTEELVDEPGEPTREALDRVLGFLAQRLLSETV